MLTLPETEGSSPALSVLSHTYIVSLGCLWFCTTHIYAVHQKTSGSNVLQAGARGQVSGSSLWFVVSLRDRGEGQIRGGSCGLRGYFSLDEGSSCLLNF